MINIDELWQAYNETKNPTLKEQLIVEYAPLVKHIAGRMMVHISQYAEGEDLESYGVFGLIDAIDKFDPGKGAKFETYAYTRIRGAIIDHIRELDWVPRALRKKNTKMKQTITKLEEQLGREPSSCELASALGVPLDAVDDLMRESAVPTLVSFDDFIDQNFDPSFGELMANQQDSPEEQAETQEKKILLAEAISKLSDKEKLAVTLYYFDDLTLKEISAVMNVSEARVSYIHSKALGKLQAKLGRHKLMLFT